VVGVDFMLASVAVSDGWGSVPALLVLRLWAYFLPAFDVLRISYMYQYVKS